MLPLNVMINVMIIGQPPITARFRWRERLAFLFYGNGNGFTFTVRHRELYLNYHSKLGKIFQIFYNTCVMIFFLKAGALNVIGIEKYITYLQISR